MKNKQKVIIDQVRQGDVLVENVAAIPADAKRQKPEHGKIILAHGEVTGHHHSIETDSADWWKTDGGEQFVTVKKAAPLSHQEHGAITLTPNKKRVIRQREYSPEAIRNVAD